MRKAKQYEETINNLALTVARLDERVNTLTQQNIDVSSAFEELNRRFESLTDIFSEFKAEFDEKEDTIKLQAEEIQKWNDGLNNIINYSVNIAKGGVRK